MSKVIESRSTTDHFTHMCTQCCTKFYDPDYAALHEHEQCITLVQQLVNRARAKARIRMNHPMDKNAFYTSQFHEELIKLVINECLNVAYFNGMAQEDYPTRLQVAQDIEARFKEIY